MKKIYFLLAMGLVLSMMSMAVAEEPILSAKGGYQIQWITKPEGFLIDTLKPMTNKKEKTNPVFMVPQECSDKGSNLTPVGETVCKKILKEKDSVYRVIVSYKQLLVSVYPLPKDHSALKEKLIEIANSDLEVK
jgi:hypothetical protein